MMVGDVIHWKLELGYLKSKIIYDNVIDYTRFLSNLNNLTKTVVDITDMFTDILELSRTIRPYNLNNSNAVNLIENPKVSKEDTEYMSLIMDLLFFSSSVFYNKTFDADELEGLYVFNDLLTSEAELSSNISFDIVDSSYFVNKLFMEKSIKLMKKFHYLRKLYLDNSEFIVSYIGYRLIEPNKRRIILTLITI